MNHGGKDLKKLIKSRRGVAIELAIGVMFTMIAFTIMLLSTAGLQNSHRNQDYKEFNERIEINNIGEHVLGDAEENANNYKSENRVPIVIDNNYSVKYTLSENKYEIYRGAEGSAELVLTIVLDSNGKITSWK